MTDATFTKSLVGARDELLWIARSRYNLTPMDAEDLVAETIGDAWRYRTRYVDYGTGMMTWLMNLLRWRALKRFRTIRRRLRYITVSDVAVDADWLAELGVRDETESRLCADETLNRALKALPSHQRDVLMLRAADHEYDEIATMLGLPLGTVKSRLFRARTRIAEVIDGHD